MNTSSQHAAARSAKIAKIGMVVLKTDETVENESRFYLQDSNVHLLTTRIPVSDTINSSTLQAMRGHLQHSLALFPEGYPFDVIAYACTSAATVIGEQTVSDDIHSYIQTTHVTNPLTAAKAAFAHLGVKKIAYLCPYVSDVADAMQQNINDSDFRIVADKSFNEGSDRAVAAITPQQILEALQTFRDSDAEAVFVSCTNLNCAPILARAEEQLQRPVISSNQALLWHAQTLAQTPLAPREVYGRLLNNH